MIARGCIVMTENEQRAVVRISDEVLDGILDAVPAQQAKYGSRSDAWGKSSVVAHVFRGVTYPGAVFSGIAGKAGEWAICAYLNAAGIQCGEPDMHTLRYGDDGVDLRAGDITISSKARLSGYRLLHRVDYSHAAMVTVASRWFKNEFVHLLGWATRDEILAAPVEKGVGDWQNRRLFDYQLRRMHTLAAFSREAAA